MMNDYCRGQLPGLLQKCPFVISELANNYGDAGCQPARDLPYKYDKIIIIIITVMIILIIITQTEIYYADRWPFTGYDRVQSGDWRVIASGTHPLLIPGQTCVQVEPVVRTSQVDFTPNMTVVTSR